MLQYDPNMRISAAETLTSPYLAAYHDPNDEPSADELIDWSFLDAELTPDVWKTIMLVENDKVSD